MRLLTLSTTSEERRKIRSFIANKNTADWGKWRWGHVHFLNYICTYICRSTLYIYCIAFLGRRDNSCHTTHLVGARQLKARQTHTYKNLYNNQFLTCLGFKKICATRFVTLPQIKQHLVGTSFNGGVADRKWNKTQILRV